MSWEQNLKNQKVPLFSSPVQPHMGWSNRFSEDGGSGHGLPCYQYGFLYNDLLLWGHSMCSWPCAMWTGYIVPMKTHTPVSLQRFIYKRHHCYCLWVFCTSHVSFLGYLLSSISVSMDPFTSLQSCGLTLFWAETTSCVCKRLIYFNRTNLLCCESKAGFTQRAEG